MESYQTRTLTVAFVLILAIAIIIATVSFAQQVYAQSINSIVINSGNDYTNSTILSLMLSSPNAIQMRFSENTVSWSEWEPFSPLKNYALTERDDNYTISVQFRDNTNQTSTATSSIILDTIPPEPLPYADWYTTDYRTVYFDASYSTDNFGIATVTWDFGDGNITSGLTIIHTYATPGNYTVTLTVLDQAGNKGTTTLLARIPDITTILTPTVSPTPEPTTYIPPTSNSTPTPTASLAIPPVNSDSSWTIALAGIVVIAIIGLIIILLLRRSQKKV